MRITLFKNKCEMSPYPTAFCQIKLHLGIFVVSMLFGIYNFISQMLCYQQESKIWVKSCKFFLNIVSHIHGFSEAKWSKKYAWWTSYLSLFQLINWLLFNVRFPVYQSWTWKEQINTELINLSAVWHCNGQDFLLPKVKCFQDLYTWISHLNTLH